MKQFVTVFLLMFIFVLFQITVVAGEMDLYKDYKIGTLGLDDENELDGSDYDFFVFGCGNIVRANRSYEDDNNEKVLVITNKNLDDLIEFTNAYISGNYENDDKVLNTILEWEKKNTFVKVEEEELLEVLQKIKIKHNIIILKVTAYDRKKPVTFYMYAKDVAINQD